MLYHRRPPTPLLMFVLCFLLRPTSGKQFFSHRGQPCIDNCRPQGFQQLHQCNVRMKDDIEVQYCSPKSNVDYRGYNCLTCCEENGYAYYWCQTASNWGYCGRVIEDSKHYTTDGLPCHDGCEQRGYGYFWCHTSKRYGYCSPQKNVDYRGNACRKDSPCDKNGLDYYWCYLEKGSWDKCAIVEPKAMVYQTINREDCTDECQYYEPGGYFWCHMKDSWDYCSPLPDLTYKNVPCRPGHKCNTYGKTYSWCYTDDKAWDYCGLIHPGECMYTLQRRRKRTPNKPQVICKKVDNNNKRETTFTATEDPGHIAQSNKKLRAEALSLINRWDNQGLGGQSRSNLITSDNLRIDLQQLINRNNQQYYNLQIQINIPRSRGQSTTIAQIIVPVDTSAEYMRQAFRESLHRRARISLEVTVTQNNQRCQ